MARCVPLRSEAPRLASHERGELSAFVELADDIATADEFSVHVELRDGRPVRMHLDLLPDSSVGEDVEGLELRAVLFESGDDFVRKAARREALIALHEEHDFVLANEAVDGYLGKHFVFDGRGFGTS